MPGADFFARLGLFVRPNFLERETCARLRAAATEARKVPGAVGNEDAVYEVDVRTRRTDIADVSDETMELVAGPVDAIFPEIAHHYSVEAEGRQGLQFLVYKEGDFFGAHTDRTESGKGAKFSKRRLVSVLIFLNDEAEEPAPTKYGGGALTFYGLLGGGKSEKVGLPVVGEEGLLVAFKSEITHAVTPVTHGERFTVVTWLV
jgi:SM-20-related protein